MRVYKYLLQILLIPFLISCGGGSSNIEVDRNPLPSEPTTETLFGKEVFIGTVSNPDYDRDSQYPTWDDTDDDCISNRHEILISRHINDDVSYPLVFSESGCRVVSGKWLDSYNNEYYYSASDIQIDHLVALYEAHISGAGNFTISEQRLFANTGDKLEGTLPETSHEFMAVSGSSNQSKGSKQPGTAADDGWMPENEDFHCIYLLKWVEIKFLNGLYFDREEYDFIKDYENQCSEVTLPDLPPN